MTKILYEINSPGYVKLSVYDAAGRHIDDLVSEYKPEGNHQVLYDGTNLSSGIYFYKLDVKSNISSVLGRTSNTNRILQVK